METTSIFTPAAPPRRVLGDGPHGAPQPGPLEKRVEDGDEPHRGEHHDEPFDRDDEPAHADDAGEGRRHRLVQYAKGELRAGLENPQEAQGDDERVESLPRRCRKIRRSDTSPTSPTTTMARSSVRR